MSIVLRASDIVKSYSLSSAQDTPVLKGISLTVERGEFLAIVGASGAGKSTLLHLIGAIETPDSGTICLKISENEEINYAELSNDQLSAMRNKHIGLIFQFHHLLPEFTALENVMMPALIAGKSAKIAAENARELLARVGLSARMEHKPSALSGGEQQRAAFARALVNMPALVLADEPTGNLDSENSERLLELMQAFRKEFQLTFVVVTHSTEIANAADRIARMKNGEFIGV